MSDKATATPTPTGPRVRYRSRCESIESTWAVEWPDGTNSAMPDEATARRCAAAGALFGACEEFERAFAGNKSAQLGNGAAYKCYHKIVAALALSRTGKPAD